MRSLMAAVNSAAQSANYTTVIMVELDFQSGFVRATDAPFNITDTSTGNTFIGIGQLGSIGVISEGADKQARGMTLSLSGIDPSLITTSMAEHYQGRDCRVYMAYLDSNHQLIPDPILLGEFFMDTMNVKIGDKAIITVAAESVLIAWERPNLLRYTDEEQQRLHPGDLGLQYIASESGKKFEWGLS